MKKVNVAKVIAETMLKAEAEFHREQAKVLMRAANASRKKAGEIERKLRKAARRRAREKAREQKKVIRATIVSDTPVMRPLSTVQEVAQ